MRVELKWHVDLWQEIKDATMTTISKNTGKYPDSAWKTKLLRSEHSPVRIGKIIVKCYDVESWVATHMVRHHIGIEKFVSTQRTDRTGTNRSELPQGALVDMTLDMNFQAIINISKKRLCKQASKETQDLWKKVLEQVKLVEPELYELCMPDCEYRGGCKEFFDCGYYDNVVLPKKKKEEKYVITLGDNFYVGGNIEDPRSFIEMTSELCNAKVFNDFNEADAIANSVPSGFEIEKIK